VTWLTPAEPEAKLIEFYQRVRPGGPGWAPFARRLNAPAPNALAPYLASWVLGCVLIYGFLFGIGALIFGQWTKALLSLGIGLLAGAGILWSLARDRDPQQGLCSS
jgi:hypothetical protein